jgi:hypothetical protein
MNKFIMYEPLKEDSNIGKIYFIHFTPATIEDPRVFEAPNSRMIDNEIPVAEERYGQTAELLINLTTGALSYRYVDRPLTSEEIIKNLETENVRLKANQTTIQAALDDFFMNILPTIMPM